MAVGLYLCHPMEHNGHVHREEISTATLAAGGWIKWISDSFRSSQILPENACRSQKKCQRNVLYSHQLNCDAECCHKEMFLLKMTFFFLDRSYLRAVPLTRQVINYVNVETIFGTFFWFAANHSFVLENARSITKYRYINSNCLHSKSCVSLQLTVNVTVSWEWPQNC